MRVLQKKDVTGEGGCSGKAYKDGEADKEEKGGTAANDSLQQVLLLLYVCFLNFRSAFLEKSQRLQKQNYKENRGDELDHSNIKFLAPEGVAVFRNLVDDGLWFYDPANQDTG